jgi:hypothetical protein
VSRSWAFSSFEKAVKAIAKDLAEAAVNPQLGGSGVEFVDAGQRWRLTVRRERHTELPDLGQSCARGICQHAYALHYWTHDNSREGCSEPGCDCPSFDGDGA